MKGGGGEGQSRLSSNVSPDGFPLSIQFVGFKTNNSNLYFSAVDFRKVEGFANRSITKIFRGNP